MRYQQILDGRYVDRKKLNRLVNTLFPNNDFLIRVRPSPGGERSAKMTPLTEPQLQLDRWILDVPRLLTEVRHFKACTLWTPMLIYSRLRSINVTSDLNDGRWRGGRIVVDIRKYRLAGGAELKLPGAGMRGGEGDQNTAEADHT